MPTGPLEHRQAHAIAGRIAGCDVGWLEEPVSANGFEGLCLLRDRAPRRIRIAAGELEAQAADVLQVDVSHSLGISGFLQVDALCAAHGVLRSAHCVPSLRLHAALATAKFWHQE